MKAWNIDANNIDLNDINTGHINNYMVITREIQDFLSPETKKMFIVAPKGLGKTYLLKVKSQLIRDSNTGFKFIPANTLCERFTNNDFSFSKTDFDKFNDIGIWKKTWEIALYTLILKSFNENTIPKEIKATIGNAGSLAGILSTLLQQRGKIVAMHKYVASDLQPAVKKLREESSTNQAAVFIDNIDEAFDNYVGYTAQNNAQLSPNIWINAQLSILFIARDICAINRHIKIFLTIRSEAYNNNQDPLRLQLDDLTVNLKYTKQEIKSIFEQNILLTSPDDLVSASHKNMIYRLTGYDKIPHKFVEDKNGNKIEESFFDFIYRHTYGRPREIVLMGKRIVEKLRPQDRSNTNRVGSVVNEVSYELFDQLKREIIPIFEDKVFESFCEKVEYNVVKRSDSERIDSEIFNELNFQSVFSYLYRIGIVGVVQTVMDSEGGTQKQMFLPVGEYTLLENRAPIVDYFILHPSVNKKMKQIHDVGYYNRFNIIGYDNEFIQQSNQAYEHHLHFGLDRDSLTIILPELNNYKCLAVVVYPDPKWSGFETSDTFLLDLNGNKYSYKVFHDNLTSVEKTKILDEWRNKSYPVIVYSDQFEEILKFYKTATTISVCLYTPFSNLFGELVQSAGHKPKHISHCIREFVEEEFNKFTGLWEASSSRVTITPVIIDRYQYSENITSDSTSKISTATVVSESYCKIIFNRLAGNRLRSNSVIQIYNEDTSFYHNVRCKNLIVEGIYQFYKAIKHSELHSSEEDLNSLVNIFSEIQIWRLFHSFPEKNEDTLFTAFSGKTKDQIRTDLKLYSEQTLNRVKHLFTKYDITLNGSNIQINKDKKIFPGNSDFYQFAASRKYTKENELELLFSLHKILEIDNDPGYHSMFISYSYKDSSIANYIYKKLKVNGINVTLFEKDNPHKHLNRYMKESVTSADKLLFIASRHSLKSDGCHTELSTCREIIRLQNDDTRLIAIRLDNYIFETYDYELSDPKRRENFEMLKNYFVSKFGPDAHTSEDPNDSKAFNENIDALIRDLKISAKS
ncbi:toll/interleukin-1 receptor domain-containing protein [Leadbetterella sp. DM7]|uniref:toll/interleukin-1 receptor domain-containing protein n=1 Tax=Leadbetterella sp. DM7 TaxID=3235085 RepID=UPI00349EE1D9